jgi:hypothetical protein
MIPPFENFGYTSLEEFTHHTSLEPGLFENAGEGRGNNDALNKQREELLEKILDIPDDALHPYYRELKQKWRACLSTLCSSEFDKIKITKKAGRSHNHDFNIQFFLETVLVHTQNVEFKHNARSIENLPQFLSLYEKQLGYMPYYYHNYLPKYLATDPGITEPIPDESTYTSKVYSSAYSCHPFFQQLYDRDNVQHAAKVAVVNESISEFLKIHAASLDMNWLAGEFNRTQKEKKYILWDLHEFHVQELPMVTALTFDRIKNGNAILVNSTSAQYSLLLRWRNHKGILLPAWQISLKI